MREFSIKFVGKGDGKIGFDIDGLQGQGCGPLAEALRKQGEIVPAEQGRKEIDVEHAQVAVRQTVRE